MHLTFSCPWSYIPVRASFLSLWRKVVRRKKKTKLHIWFEITDKQADTDGTSWQKCCGGDTSEAKYQTWRLQPTRGTRERWRFAAGSRHRDVFLMCSFFFFFFSLYTHAKESRLVWLWLWLWNQQEKNSIFHNPSGGWIVRILRNVGAFPFISSRLFFIICFHNEPLPVTAPWLIQ